MTEQKKDCAFCGEGDMLIFPLRYAVLGADDDVSFPSISKVHLSPLPDTLGKTDCYIESALTNCNVRYTIRPLRRGFLYVLLVKSGKKEWQAYEVTEGAELCSFPANDPLLAPAVFSCTTYGHRVNASMVKIKNPQEIEKAYMIFTPDPITETMLNDYKANAEAYVKEGRWQSFSPAEWAKGVTAQKDAATSDLLPTFVAEALATVSSSLVEPLNKSLFPPYKDDNPEPHASIAPHVAHLANIQAQLRPDTKAPNGHPVFVLYDAIGITQELNAWRNEPMVDYRLWLSKVDADGVRKHVTNEHRAMVLGAMDDAKQLMTLAERNYRPSGPGETGGTYSLRKIIEEEEEKCDIELKGLIPGRPPSEEEKVRIRKKYVDRINTLLSNNDGGWKNRYSRDLDVKYIERFRSRHEKMSEDAHNKVLARWSPHLIWLKSLKLRAAFAVYDDKDSGSGANMSNQFGVCIVGMAYTPQGDKEISKWVQDFDIKHEDNLLMEAFCFNQKEVKEALRVAHIDIKGPDLDTVESVEKFHQYLMDSLYGVNELKDAEVPKNDDGSGWLMAGKIKSGLKTLAKLMDRHVKAVEEPARDAAKAGQAFNKDSMPKYIKSDKFGLKYFNRFGRFVDKNTAVFTLFSQKSLSFALSKPEQWIAKKLIAINSASLGRQALALQGIDFKSELREALVNKKLSNKEYMNNIFEKLENEKARARSPSQGTPQSRSGSDLAKQAKEETLGKWKTNQSLGSDYIRVRTASQILIFESLFLITAFKNFDHNKNAATVLAASAFSTVAAGAEMYAYGYRSLRDSSDKVIKESAAIIYGRAKLWAAGFALGASGIMAYLTYQDAKKAKEAGKTTLAYLLYATTFANGGLAIISLLTGYAETAAFFTYLAKKVVVNHPYWSKAFGWLSLGAEQFGKRLIFGATLKAVLYRIGAFFARINIYLFIAVLIYDMVKDDELNDWCEKSCFSEDMESPDGKEFANFEEERQSLFETAEAIIAYKWPPYEEPDERSIALLGLSPRKQPEPFPYTDKYTGRHADVSL